MDKRKPDQQKHSDGKSDQRKVAEEAHREADKDIARDPDLSLHSPNDDLDEGELARLGEDKTGLV